MFQDEKPSKMPASKNAESVSKQLGETAKNQTISKTGEKIQKNGKVQKATQKNKK